MINNSSEEEIYYFSSWAQGPDLQLWAKSSSSELRYMEGRQEAS